MTKTCCTKKAQHNIRFTCLGTSEQRQWTCSRYFLHWRELQPTPSPQTPQEFTFKTLLFYRNNSCNVLSTFTLKPFPSTAFFYLPYLSKASFNDSLHKTRSSACNNSVNELYLISSVRTSITIINISRLKASPWLTPTFTENKLDRSLTTEITVLQPS